MNSKDDSLLLTFAAAADMCGLKTPTFRKWAHERRFPVVKLGRAVRIRRADLERLIEQSILPALEVDNGQESEVRDDA